MTAKTHKCYVIMVGARYPKHHPRAGQPTDFERLISAGVKIHTIRYNYDDWAAKADKVNRGEAYISLRVWEGRPYGRGATIREIKRLTSVCVQKLSYRIRCDADHITIDNMDMSNKTHILASNDGLSMQSLQHWLMPNIAVPFHGCIIHFTPHRYGS